MSTENDNKIVDFLYDDLDPEARKVFLGRIEEDPELGSQVSSYSAMLKLVREQGEELAPAVASTERLVEEARRASRPWPARLLGGWLPALFQRPAVAIATLAVLVLGLGVFSFLSGHGEAPGALRSGDRERRAEAPRSERSLEEAPSSAPAAGGIRDARGGSATVAASEPDADKNEAIALSDKTKLKEGKEAANVDGPSQKDDRLALGRAEDLEQAKKAGAGDTASARKGRAISGEAAQRADQGVGRNGLEGTTSARGGLAKPSPTRDPAPGGPPSQTQGTLSARLLKTPQAKAPMGTYVHQTKSGQAQPPSPIKLSYSTVVSKTGGVAAKDEKAVAGAKQAETRSAPVLYNLANTSLSKGNISQACDLFAALVRTHRDDPRRADALLGWARCETARGAYGRAEAIIGQLVKEHPSWRKSGETFLAEIQKQRQLAVLRAQRRIQAAKRQQPAKATPRRATSNTSSY